MFQNGIIDQCLKEIFKITNDIIKKYGSRIAGSESCINTAEYLMEYAKKTCDKVYLQKYEQYPRAFYSITYIFASCYIIASILNLFSGIYLYISLSISVFGMFYLFSQFIFLGSLFDKLFKRESGYNIIGIIEPKNDVKQQIILSAHHDSTYICNFLEKHPEFYAFRMIIPLLFYIIEIIITILFITFQILNIHNASYVITFNTITFFGYIFIIPFYYYHNQKGTLGVGDNLISSIMCIKLPEIIEKIEGKLENTKLIILSNDGEEIGQKGSQAFIKEHINTLTKIKTIVINIDSIYSVEDLAFLTTEINGTKKLNRELIKEIEKITKEIGYKLVSKKLPIGGGGTDAGQFAKKNIDVISLIGISTNLIRKKISYHTSRDTIESIDPKAIEIVLKTLIRFIQKKDKEINTIVA